MWNLGNNAIGAQGFAAIVVPGSAMSAGEVFDFQSNEISGNALQALASDNHALKGAVTINFSDNRVGFKGARNLAKANFSNLRSLNLQSTQLDAAALRELLKPASHLKDWSLDELDLTENGLGDEGVKVLVNSRVTLTSIRRVNFNENGPFSAASQAAFKALAESIKGTTELIWE